MFHLPLLNSLKTFVVAGHYLNFTKASEDLLVSPSAVSHQIRVLEDYLGFKLFTRKNRNLTFTVEGAQLHASLEEPFNQIARTLHNVLQNRGIEILNISLRPFFSNVWLTKRLNSFWEENPQIQINLTHSIKIPNFSTDNIDIAIVWGKGNWTGMKVKLLVPSKLTPICSPILINQQGYPKNPSELKRYALIHDEDHSAWRTWLDQSGAKNVSCKNNLIIDDTNVRVQSVINGQGIMLGSPTLLKNYLDNGNLVQLFDSYLDDYAYYLIYSESLLLTDSMKIFIDWVTSEAKISNNTEV